MQWERESLSRECVHEQTKSVVLSSHLHRQQAIMTP
jgi:hypothetical protein